jgi:hypothetical protein
VATASSFAIIPFSTSNYLVLKLKHPISLSTSSFALYSTMRFSKSSIQTILFSAIKKWDHIKNDHSVNGHYYFRFLKLSSMRLTSLSSFRVSINQYRRCATMIIGKTE